MSMRVVVQTLDIFASVIHDGRCLKPSSHAFNNYAAADVVV